MRNKNIGQVIKSTGSWYYVKTDDEVIKCKLRGKYKLDDSKRTNPIAVGDYVDFITEKGTSVIENIHNRKNELVRKSTNLSRRGHVIAANIDVAFLMVTLKMPKTYYEFIDRFLVAAEYHNIETAIIVNKIDLYNEEDLSELEYLSLSYKKIGYDVFEISVKENKNIDQIRSFIKDKTILISGNSGVGKSSLINCLQPNLDLKTDEVSDMHKQGRHTTTFAQMYDIAGGKLIDTPGIKGFGLLDIEKEKLSHYFKEINPIRKDCKYNNCTHTHEPECAVKKAVEEFKISPLRYENYLSIYTDDETKYREDAYR